MPITESPFFSAKAFAIRFTKVGTCGIPLSGPANRFITKGFISVELAPQWIEGNDEVTKNAQGDPCMKSHTPGTRDYWTPTLTLCGVSPTVTNILTGWDVIADSEGRRIGNVDAEKVQTDGGVAVELWLGQGEAESCQIITNDNDIGELSQKTYGYVIFFANEFKLQGITAAETISNFQLIGRTFPGYQWGKGLYNVITGKDSNDQVIETRLPDNIWKKDSHVAWLATRVAPPITEMNDGEALPVDMDLFAKPPWYFGDQSNPPVEVAPDQPNS